MADLFVQNQPQDSFHNQNQSSSTDHLPSREQRRQETTSSYTSMGTTPDFETLLNEQAESRGGSGHGNPINTGGMWGLGGFDSQSPVGGNGHRFESSTSQQQQQQHHLPSHPQSISNNQRSSPNTSSQGYGMPLSAPTQSRRVSGTGSLPRDRRRSSDNLEGASLGTTYLSGTVSSRECVRLTSLILA